MAQLTAPTPRRRRGDPDLSVRVDAEPAGRGSGRFGYAIELDSSEPQEAAVIERALRLVAGLPPARRDALAAMPFQDALDLLTAALPAPAGSDELVGPFYDTEGLARRWRISAQAVHKRADKARRLLKVITADGVALYPAFQFDSRGGLLPRLPEVIDAFEPAVSDRWTIARWLAAPNPALQGRAPADLLREGEGDRVLAAAAALAGRLAA